MPYSKLAMDHFGNPRNVGEWPDGTPGVATGLAGRARCGDVVKIQLRIEDERIAESRCKVYGCAMAVAAASLAAELAEGKSLEWVRQLNDGSLAERLDAPPQKRSCAALAVEALHAAAAEWENRLP